MEENQRHREKLSEPTTNLTQLLDVLGFLQVIIIIIVVINSGL